jgi:hypothetical protein
MKYVIDLCSQKLIKSNSLYAYMGMTKRQLYSAVKTAIDHLGMTPAQVEKYSSSTKDNEGGGK